ncbi:DUF2911 domain-containing protein [Robertkochia marina]|uniref:DUF2911 domain-containing protein n=1 Tax=Robertkochia marina TaxID=1227945 RepID=A0A4S3LZI2_9FLAO|nr:DUF2911 domain-containing protein [Robertkochia marina]THD67522.1 DUF2911 domain-containing protein [Robertkochia marina]TRZ44611.1 DUF2911 domain-containing protein [Robertkochia marina]
MKKILLAICFLAASYVSEAQVTTPQPSPSSTITQTVGLTEVSVTFSRPSMRGRSVFGDLVPFDKVWRTGANANTIVKFEHDVKVGGSEVKAGAYALFTKPGKDSWEIILYNDTSNWGAPQEWDESKVVASVTSEIMELPFDVETFSIGFANLTNNGADLGIYWENTYVAMPFEVPTQELAMASIEKTLNGPGSRDYFSAAVYYLEEGQDLEKAKMWMDKALEGQEEPAYWMLRQKSLILAAMGDKKGAIETAKQSLAGAEKAGNADYVALNKKSLEEWGAN